MEFLKPIKGYPNYTVSADGCVFSRNKKLKPIKGTKGYLTVCLCKDGVVRRFSVHRLVATAFIPNPENKQEVNHKNGVRTDNGVDNLEWVTHKENIVHSFVVLKRNVVGSRKGKFGKDCPGTNIIQQIKDGLVIGEFFGSAEAQRITGVNQGHIIDCCNGKRKTAGGFLWEKRI